MERNTYLSSHFSSSSSSNIDSVSYGVKKEDSNGTAGSIERDCFTELTTESKDMFSCLSVKMKRHQYEIIS